MCVYARVVGWGCWWDGAGWCNVYGSLPKTSNTLNIRTPKIIAKYNFKMFPKISNSG